MIHKCTLNTSQVFDEDARRFPKALLLCIDILGFIHKELLAAQIRKEKPFFQHRLANEVPASYVYDASFIRAEDAIFKDDADATVRITSFVFAHNQAEYIELCVRFLAPHGKILSQLSFTMNEDLQVHVSFMEGSLAQWMTVPR